MEPEKLKVTELRDELATRGLSTKGLKAELVARLQEFLAGNPGDVQTEDKPVEDAVVEPAKPLTSPKKTRASPRKQAKKTEESEEIQNAEEQEYSTLVEVAATDANVLVPAPKRSKSYEHDQADEFSQTEEPTLANEAEEQSQSDKPNQAYERSAVVPMAENPKSTVIHITNLHRPFHEKQLKGLIGMDFAADFWLNNIKSECLVRFETIELAEDCRTRLHNKTFPADSEHVLKVDFGTVEQLSEKQKTEIVTEVSVGAEASLTTYFKKTTVEPAIYYLPKKQ